MSSGNWPTRVKTTFLPGQARVIDGGVSANQSKLWCQAEIPINKRIGGEPTEARCNRNGQVDWV